jgi:hypothetical protein
MTNIVRRGRPIASGRCASITARHGRFSRAGSQQSPPRSGRISEKDRKRGTERRAKDQRVLESRAEYRRGPRRLSSAVPERPRSGP